MSSGGCCNTDHGDKITKDIGSDSLLPFDGPVHIYGKQKQLQLSQAGLVLSGTLNSNTQKINSFEDLTLTWPDVVCASKDLSSKSGLHTPSFTLHYINQVNNKRRVHKVQITVTDGQVDHWVSAITEKCSRVAGRPRKVFVVVNPIGGAGQGRQIYQKTVAPLFELAKITTDVIYTERSKHALELGEKLDFSGYDAILTVGGDGLYQEVLLGLTLQVQKAAGVNIDNPDTEFVQPGITFGIIPAGTGNCLAQWLNGTRDVLTAALGVIRGENHRAQVMRIYSNDKFVTLSGLIVGNGEFSDFMKRSDDRRWMGRMRNLYAVVAALVKTPRMFKCQIEYKLADNQKRPGNSQSSIAREIEPSAAEWKMFAPADNPVCGLMAVNCEGIPNKRDLILTPYGTYVNLLVDSGSGRMDMMKTLLQWMSGTNAATPLPPKWSRIPQVTGFRLKIIPDESKTDNSSSTLRERNEELAHYLDIDGEAVWVDSPDVEVRVQAGYISVYGHQWSPPGTEV